MLQMKKIHDKALSEKTIKIMKYLTSQDNNIGNYITIQDTHYQELSDKSRQ